MPNAKDLAFFLPSKKLKLLNNTQFRKGFLWQLETIPTRNEPCPRCGEFFSDGFKNNQRSTGRFEKFIAEMCESFSNISEVQRRFRCSSSFAYKVFYKYQEIKLKEKINYTWPSVIGIDEHFFTRRNGYVEYATVLTDMNKKRLYEMVQGKDTKTLLAQLGHLQGREQVKLVVMGMSSTYRNFVREFFPTGKWYTMPTSNFGLKSDSNHLKTL